MKLRAQILFYLAGLLTAVPAAQAHFFSGLFSARSSATSPEQSSNSMTAPVVGFGTFSLGLASFATFKCWELNKRLAAAENRVAIAEQKVVKEHRKLRISRRKTIAAIEEVAKQKKENYEKRLKWYSNDDSSSSNSSASTQAQENLLRREVPGKVTQSSSSSRVRLGWWELPEETEIDLQEKGHMPKPKRACWWELPNEAVKGLDNVTIDLPEPQKGDKGCWWA